MGKEFYKNNDIQNSEKLQELLKELPVFCREFFIGISQRTSALTRLNYAYDLKIFFFFLSENINHFYGRNTSDYKLKDLESIDVSDIELFLDYLGSFFYNGTMHTNSPEAKSRKLSTLRSFFKYFYNKNKLPYDVTAKVSVPKKADKPIIRLEIDEVVKILNAADNGIGLSDRQKAFHTKTQLRDLAILTLFLGTGIRISELAGLNTNDLDFNSDSFKVTRKGGKQEILYFSSEVSDCLQKYVHERAEYKTKETALFLSLQNKRISVRALQNLVKKYAEIAAPLKKITPHKLRSTFGTNLYRETNDIYVVAEVLGHKDINTTKKHYAAISDDIKRNAANKVALRDEEK